MTPEQGADPEAYPVEDPAQAWNVLTIGGFTDRDDVAHPDYRGWTAAAAVEAVEFFCFRVPIDDEQIAADATAHRLDDAQHGVGGNRRVGRIAARFQHVESRL